MLNFCYISVTKVLQLCYIVGALSHKGPAWNAWRFVFQDLEVNKLEAGKLEPARALSWNRPAGNGGAGQLERYKLEWGLSSWKIRTDELERPGKLEPVGELDAWKPRASWKFQAS